MEIKRTLWSEKYRPETPSELEVPEPVRRFLANAIETGNYPHLLLHGRPGCGKTTFAQMLKPTLTLNASDERGIDIVRNRIKKAAQLATPQVILLDECENLTRDAQTCLRRILEDYPNTRFIFVTNYYSKIIDPLKSRLLKIKFGSTSSGILEKIWRSENGSTQCTALAKYVFGKANGDLRKSINILQGLSPLLANTKHGNDNDEQVGKIEADLVDRLLGEIPQEIVDEFLLLHFSAHSSFIDRFIRESYSVLQLIQQLSTRMQTDKLMDDSKRVKLMYLLSELEHSCVLGCADEIVLAKLCMGII